MRPAKSIVALSGMRKLPYGDVRTSRRNVQHCRKYTRSVPVEPALIGSQLPKPTPATPGPESPPEKLLRSKTTTLNAHLPADVRTIAPPSASDERAHWLSCTEHLQGRSRRQDPQDVPKTHAHATALQQNIGRGVCGKDPQQHTVNRPRNWPAKHCDGLPLSNSTQRQNRSMRWNTENKNSVPGEGGGGGDVILKIASGLRADTPKPQDDVSTSYGAP